MNNTYDVGENEEQGWPLRWELLMRYRLIEIVALWEGRLTTKHLCNSLALPASRLLKILMPIYVMLRQIIWCMTASYGVTNLQAIFRPR